MSLDRGSATVEIVVVTPVLLALLLFAVFLGRLASARDGVDAAARDAARAASIARSSDESEAAGRDAASSALVGRGVTCRRLVVGIDSSDFRPDATVTATVTCTADLSDLTLIGVPATRTITARFSEPVDTYRGVDT